MLHSLEPRRGPRKAELVRIIVRPRFEVAYEHLVLVFWNFAVVAGVRSQIFYRQLVVVTFLFLLSSNEVFDLRDFRAVCDIGIELENIRL